MHANSPRPRSLASPAFVAALGLLVLNDFLFKPLFHDWVTGKLSDFAGLFALAIFCAAFWPRHRRLIGTALTAAFVFWKSGSSQPLIDWLNGFAPLPIARTVDYSDLWALPAVWLGLRAERRMQPWSLPGAAQGALALFAAIAFTATSIAREGYVVRSTVEVAPPSVAAADAAELQTLVDEVARKHGLPCRVCDPLDEGRVYYDGSKTLTVSFDADTQAVFFQIFGSGKRAPEKEVDRISMDIRAALSERFPDLKLTSYVARLQPYPYEDQQSTIFTVHLDAATLDVATVESARRTLSQIVEETVREHGLRIDKDSTVYYAGKRTGIAAQERELVLTMRDDSHESLGIGLTLRSDKLDALYRSVAATLEQRLDAAFGERVTVARPR